MSNSKAAATDQTAKPIQSSASTISTTQVLADVNAALTQPQHRPYATLIACNDTYYWFFKEIFLSD
jgi:hypothetical protein